MVIRHVSAIVYSTTFETSTFRGKNNIFNALLFLCIQPYKRPHHSGTLRLFGKNTTFYQKFQIFSYKTPFHPPLFFFAAPDPSCSRYPLPSAKSAAALSCRHTLHRQRMPLGHYAHKRRRFRTAAGVHSYCRGGSFVQPREYLYTAAGVHGSTPGSARASAAQTCGTARTK